jgi:hypothetical protein
LKYPVVITLQAIVLAAITTIAHAAGCCRRGLLIAAPPSLVEEFWLFPLSFLVAVVSPVARLPEELGALMPRITRSDRVAYRLAATRGEGLCE